MGKRARVKKQQKIAEVLADKSAVEQRRQIRLAPMIELGKRLVVTLMATGLILWVGVYVSANIPAIISRFSEGGS